jgi:hypothetical protein
MRFPRSPFSVAVSLPLYCVAQWVRYSITVLCHSAKYSISCIMVISCWPLCFISETIDEFSNRFNIWGSALNIIRFEVFTEVTMKNAIFWDVAPCRCFVNQRFGGTNHIHLQDRKIHERGTSVSRWLQPPKRLFTKDLTGPISQKMTFCIKYCWANFILFIGPTKLRTFIRNTSYLIHYKLFNVK